MHSALEQSVTASLTDAAPHLVSGATRMRVGYDARFSIGRYRGMGRYLRRLVRGYEKQFLALCAKGEFDSELPVVAGGFRLYPLWEQVSIPNLVRRHSIGVLIAPYNTAPLRLDPGTKLVLVVHDFMFMEPTSQIPLSESAYQNFGRLYRRLVVPRAIRKAHRVICVSRETERQLLRRYRVAPGVVEVIPNTVSEDWFQTQRREDPQPMIFCVSGEASNKNLQKGLEGYALMCRYMPAARPLLCVAGVKAAYHGRYYALAERLGVRQNVRLLDYLSEVEMRQFYSRAQALFFPSTYEGFGIPVLEALACGTPVVASNATSMPEVATDAALYFDPAAPEEMARQLAKVVANPALREEMSAAGKQRALYYHPSRVDSIIAEFWKRLLAE